MFCFNVLTFRHKSGVRENGVEQERINNQKRGKQNEKQEKKPKKQNKRDHDSVNSDCINSWHVWLLGSFWILRKRGSKNVYF